jgi:Ca-activated chloride channel family protein
MMVSKIKEKIAAGSFRSRSLVQAALIVSLFTVAIAIWHSPAAGNSPRLLSLFLTADQQGQRLFRSGAYGEAAQRFADPAWRATALYRDGEFQDAAAAYGLMTSAEALYNQGTALIMQGKYQEAVKVLDSAVSLKPDWQAAVDNRSVAVARAERVKKEGGEMTGGMLEADEYVFSDNKTSGGQADESAMFEAQNPAEMRAIWLRQVQTRPGEFLKAKFAYQQSVKGKTNGQ